MENQSELSWSWRVPLPPGHRKALGSRCGEDSLSLLWSESVKEFFFQANVNLIPKTATSDGRLEIGFFRQTDWHPTASKWLPNQPGSFQSFPHISHCQLSLSTFWLVFLTLSLWQGGSSDVQLLSKFPLPTFTFAPLSVSAFVKTRSSYLCRNHNGPWWNIARIANAVPCHSLFKGHNVTRQQ